MNKVLKDFTEEDRKEICAQYIQGKSGGNTCKRKQLYNKYNI